MEDDRSISPSSMASSHDEHDSDMPDIRAYPPVFKYVIQFFMNFKI